MIEEVRFDIGPKDDEAELSAFIADQVAKNAEFVAALTRDLQRHDPLAIYVARSFAVDSVVCTGRNEVHITYRYDWEAFRGCSDMRFDGKEVETIIGHIIGNQLTVQIHRQEERSTHDEL